MRVGMVTTWGCRCGIATYSEGLCRALRKHGVMPAPLVPQGVSRPRHVEDFTPTEAWHKDDTTGVNVKWLSDAVERLRLDVVHVQHEYGLHADGRVFLRVVRALSRVAPVFVTLHTVPLSTGLHSRYGWLAALRRFATGVICHTAAGAASVSNVPGEATVLYIPHGTPPAQQGDLVRGLKLLGLDRKPSSVGVSVGFIGSSKNVSCTALAFGECLARRLVPGDATFFICGDPSGDASYLVNSLRPAVDSTGAAGVNLHLIERFIKDDELADLFAAADYAVLNTSSDNLSASGQVHQLAAYGVPAAVANRPIYVEGIQAGAVPFHVTTEPGRPDHPTPSLVSAIAGLATNVKLRAQVATDMQRYGAATSWDVVAGRHVKAYRAAAAAREEA